MRPLDSVVMVLLAAVLTMAAPAAFPAPPKSRAEALAALKNADTATRAEAVVWIANRGSMADAPLLHERLRDESAFVRSFAEQGLWLLWTRSGDAQIDGLMAQATEEMQAARYGEAIKLLNQVVEKKPAFAEGWNRRAYVHYMKSEVDQALGDLRRTLALDPNHFKALDGLAQILREIGQKRPALKAFKQLLDVHPYWSGAQDAVDELEREVEGQGI